jgi:hypothetical protein
MLYPLNSECGRRAGQAIMDNQAEPDEEAPVLPERDWGELDDEDRLYHGE